MKFAVSSSVPGLFDMAHLQAACVASAKGLARLAAWWSIAAPTVECTDQIGATLDDPVAYDVHIVQDLSQFPGCDDDLAMHTVENGRPVCYISAAKCMGDGSDPNWVFGPDGLWVALDHELKECTVNPTCADTVQGPTCLVPKEVCDMLQGTDYAEPGSAGIYLANAYGPGGLSLGTTRAAGLDIASDLRQPTATESFWVSPRGYFEDATTGQITFGTHYPEANKERVLRSGPRGGLVRQVRRMPW